MPYSLQFVLDCELDQFRNESLLGVVSISEDVESGRMIWEFDSLLLSIVCQLILAILFLGSRYGKVFIRRLTTVDL